MLSEVRYDFSVFGVRESCSRSSDLRFAISVEFANGLAMSEKAEGSELDETLLSVWRQALLERQKRVTLDDDSYPVQHTAKTKLAQVDFDFAGQRIRGLEQNPATASRWAELARKGAKVMQFLIAGRYIGAVSDGKVTHFGKK
jgi:hypothetical protein